jgi:ATP-binding cassette subfamily F protein 3
MLLRLDGVARTLGVRTLFRDASLLVNRGDRVGLVGPNGAGKTTLLKIAAGEDPPDAGAVVRPRGVRVGMLRQEIDPDRDVTVHAEAATALAELDRLEAELRELEAAMARAGREGREVPADVAEAWDRAHRAFEFGGGFEREARVDRVLEGLGFDADRRERPLSSFSGGWLMRVELAKLLLAAPDVLLLDEPTNHLDLPSIQWFEDTLDGFGGAVVMISHDRTFLRRKATRIAELENARFTVYEGGYDRYLEQKAERREQLLAQQKTQQREIAQTERFIERFRYKNTKAKQVQSRVKKLARMERIEVEDETRRAMRLRIPEPERAGEAVLRLEAIHKAYGETVVYDGMDFLVRRGERVALVGPNGAGKSTLLRIAAGVLPFDAGRRELGHRVKAAFYAQHQLEALDAGRTVLGELESVARFDDHPRLRGHLGAFLFSGDDVQKKVSVLSGGEKARLALAKMLLRPANFLVLDEPTNHLDVVACEVLEEALQAYGGTLLFISHDRTLIDAVATKVVEVRAGRLDEFLGTYSQWVARSLGDGLADGTPEAARAAAGAGGGGDAAALPDAREATPKPSKAERIAARQREKELVRRLARARKKLAALEDEIAEGEERIEELGHRLGDPEVYRDGDAVRTLEAERSEHRGAVDALYRDWERVAAEIESLEQAPSG